MALHHAGAAGRPGKVQVESGQPLNAASMEDALLQQAPAQGLADEAVRASDEHVHVQAPASQTDTKGSSG